jgi:hypothetical protein
LFHTIAGSRHDRFWTAEVRRYRLFQWTLDGRAAQALERVPDWFPESAALREWTPRAEPRPSVTAIEEDAEGLLWVFVSLAAPTWREAWAGVQEGVREVRASEIAFERTAPSSRSLTPCALEWWRARS